MILWAMFLHIVDDFYLQGILKYLKQKSWWTDKIKELDDKGIKHPNYDNDYLVGLIMHSFSWTFLTMLPIFIKLDGSRAWTYTIAFIINFFIHMIVDDLKCNKYKINLIIDQYIHVFQIMITYCIFEILII